MKISGRFVRVTNTKFVPDRLIIYEGEAITFKLDATDPKCENENIYQVSPTKSIKYRFLVFFWLFAFMIICLSSHHTMSIYLGV